MMASMERYTADTEPFEEDPLPSWLLRQQEDARFAEAEHAKRERRSYIEGEAVGDFIFVRMTRYKNRAVFRCPECGRQFVYNLYAIRNKKRCKWYRFHDRPKRKG